MPRSAVVTVVFTDIVGSTDLLARLGDSAFDEMRRQHFAELRAAVTGHGGTEVKNLGDGLMLVFSSANAALDASLDLQRAARRVVVQGRSVDIRIGVSLGEAVNDEDDWFGTPVVEASRLCAKAGPGEIWATDVVRVLCSGHTPVRFSPLGPLQLKGFDRPVAAVQVEAANQWRASTFGDTVRHDADIGRRLAASLDYWEQLPGIQRLRACMRDHLALSSGEVLVDIGCGTGTELAWASTQVGPMGNVIGVDASGPMVEQATARVGDLPGVQLLCRDGSDTGLPDGSCDAVRMERVLQHTGRAEDFCAEIGRLLRPGGRVVLGDSDWGSLMMHPGDRSVLMRIKAGFESGPVAEPWAGRKLASWLLDAGFTDVGQEAFFVTTDAGLRDATRTMVERIVAAGIVTEAEFAVLDESWTRAQERGDFHYSFVMFAAWGRTPSGNDRR